MYTIDTLVMRKLQWKHKQCKHKHECAFTINIKPLKPQTALLSSCLIPEKVHTYVDNVHNKWKHKFCIITKVPRWHQIRNFSQLDIVLCPDPTHVRTRESGYTSPNRKNLCTSIWVKLIQQYYGLVCAVCFQDLLQQLEVHIHILY